MKIYSGKNLTFITCDDQKVIVPIEAAIISITIKHMIEDISNISPHFSIPLTNINKRTLDKIVDYCKFFFENDLNPPYEKFDMTDWEKTYFDIDIQFLTEITNASDFLAIEPLFDLACERIASLIKRKDVDKIKDLFGLDTMNVINEPIISDK